LHGEVLSTILKNIRQKFSKALYVQVWEHRLRVSVINSTDVFDEKPLMAIETTASGKKIITAIGNSAESLSAPNIEIFNPFSHPRSLIADFQVAEKILQHVFGLLHKGSYIRPSPDVIFHPMEKIEGGLTQIEKRAFREMFLGSGAFETYFHVGPPLTLVGRDFSALIQDMEQLI
jgi:rod shape-determining protein MreB